MVLTEENFLLYCMHHYQVPSCVTIEEFENDLKTVTYIKKQLGRKDRNVRLLLNHIVILFNCFGDAALPILFHKVERESWSALVTFLLYINRMPDVVPDIGVKLTDVNLDEAVIKELRKI